MKFHKAVLIGLCSATSFAGLAISSSASADVGVFFNSAPPAPRSEPTPSPRSGYVWVGGYWDLKSNRHVWQKGHWERERRGYTYAQPTWVQRNDRWELQRGSWRRGDQDHDGVPNRLDRDRDGDGVPNRRDDSPNNPNRH